MSKKITHHFSGCIGCGACASICPAHFMMDTEIFKAKLIDGELNESNSTDPVTSLVVDNVDAATADLLTSSCPAGIIEVAAVEK